MIDSASNTLSIIIVNYKSWKVLRDCLNSISEIIIDDTEIETIVVDNASNDGEITTFQNDFPLIIFLENTGNNGFSNACNLGAKTAKGKYLLFLNPDTNKPYTIQWVNKRFNALKEDYSFLRHKNFSSHSLRKTHAFAVYQLYHYDLMKVKEVLQHRSIASTQHYLKINETEREQLRSNIVSNLFTDII